MRRPGSSPFAASVSTRAGSTCRSSAAPAGSSTSGAGSGRNSAWPTTGPGEPRSTVTRRGVGAGTGAIHSRRAVRSDGSRYRSTRFPSRSFWCARSAVAAWSRRSACSVVRRRNTAERSDILDIYQISVVVTTPARSDLEPHVRRALADTPVDCHLVEQVQTPAAVEGRLGRHLDLGPLPITLVDHLALDRALGAHVECQGDRALGAELDRIGHQLGDDQLQILEHLRREDLVEHLERGASLRGCVVGGWELEAELHVGARHAPGFATSPVVGRYQGWRPQNRMSDIRKSSRPPSMIRLPRGRRSAREARPAGAPTTTTARRPATPRPTTRTNPA